MTKITILGAGKWGTALGNALALSGHTIMLWDQDHTILRDISKRRENRSHFPGVPLHANVHALEDLEHALLEADVIFVALPARAHTSVATAAAPLLRSNQILVQTSAGLRESDGALLSAVWQEVAVQTLTQVILAGPNLATEVMAHKHTAFVLAAKDVPTAQKVAKLFTVPFIRPYLSTDIVGAQLGAAVRSILAIAAGMSDGLALGTNATAAMLCRGLHELARLAVAMGAQERTIYGLAGMGDILLNATTPLSRNYRLGKLLGEGYTLDKALKKVGDVDGIVNARMVTYLAHSYGLDLAIISGVDGVLHGDITPQDCVNYLMQRPIQMEFVAV